MYRHRQCTLWSDRQLAIWRSQIKNALQLEAFIDWLSWSDPAHARDIVGMANRIDECPLRNYLAETVPHLDCEVGRSHISTNMPDGHYCNGSSELIYLRSLDASDNLPDWVTKFVDAIDDECMRKTETYKRWFKGEIGGMLSDYEFPIERCRARIIARLIQTAENGNVITIHVPS
jgi:hypothetical protein